MNEHEEKLKTALAEKFGANANKLFSSINVKSFNLGGVTPRDYIEKGGDVDVAISAINPTLRAC